MPLSEKSDYARGVEDARHQIIALINTETGAGYVETAGLAYLCERIKELPTPDRSE